MKTMVASIIAAAGASACCLGPVVFSLAGAFYNVYRRPSTDACDANGVCPPDRHRRAKQLLWVATAIVLLLAAFPYYVGWFI